MTCIFVNETHIEHLLFHHYLLCVCLFVCFLASCVILEKLTELGHQSQKVTGNSVSFSMFGDGKEILFLSPPNLYCLSFPVIPQQE